MISIFAFFVINFIKCKISNNVRIWAYLVSNCSEFNIDFTDDKFI